VVSNEECLETSKVQQFRRKLIQQEQKLEVKNVERKIKTCATTEYKDGFEPKVNEKCRKRFAVLKKKV